MKRIIERLHWRGGRETDTFPQPAITAAMCERDAQGFKAGEEPLATPNTHTLENCFRFDFININILSTFIHPQTCMTLCYFLFEHHTACSSYLLLCLERHEGEGMRTELSTLGGYTHLLL